MVQLTLGLKSGGAAVCKPSSPKSIVMESETLVFDPSINSPSVLNYNKSIYLLNA
jgi:hypothetical protein